MPEDRATRVDAGVLAINVVRRGAVPDEAVAYARRKVSRVIEHTKVPVLFARVKLLHHGDPARARPALTEVVLDVDGHLVRAHQWGTGFREAVDLADARLRNRLRHLHDRRR